MTKTSRARAYITKMHPAIAGHGGHKATFCAACRLVEFGLTMSEAWLLLSEWNQTHCQPLWTEKDLAHKLNDAFRCTSPKAHFVNSPEQLPSVSNCLPAATANCPALPSLHTGTAEEIALLAELRGLPREGIALAIQKGLLRFGKYIGRPAWFIVDSSGQVVQARRLDGQPWVGGPKALVLPGFKVSWPVGILEAARYPFVLLVEGGPDLLAACSFIVAEGRTTDCAPVAMLSGSPLIHMDAVALFSGKSVRIFPHLDCVGENAAIRWAEQIREVGAKVDAFRLDGLRRKDEAPIKDLCDLIAIHADDFEDDRSIWKICPP